jgi:hypothetical protein
MTSPTTITKLLIKWCNGGKDAFDELVTLLQIREGQQR